MAAQLFGLALGVLVLDTPGLSESHSALALTWLSMRLLHLWLRYQSLSVLQFDSINLKRACILANSHVLRSVVPGCQECNRMENILVWPRFLKPRIVFGVALDEMIGGNSQFSLVRLVKLFAKESYILVVNRQQLKDFEVSVIFKEGATNTAMLRSVWQTFWLYQNWGWSDNVGDLLEQSLHKLEERFEHFLDQLETEGWDTKQLNLKVPKEVLINEIPP